ncbi:MAG: Clp protease ClpP [Comamonadaceae bacterium]|nr:MAG: Clp protease ClpP [Comamonadaceae bacterium]
MKHLLNLLGQNKHIHRTPLNFAKNEAGSEGTMFIYDVIYDGDGWGVSAMNVISAFSQLGDGGTMRMRYKSPGGDVMEAKAIVSAMREFKAKGGRIIGQVDAVAASCASWMVEESDEIEIVDGAFIMIHEVVGGAVGSPDELRRVADVFDLIQRSIADLYVGRTGNALEQVQAWMKEETWFTADDAVAKGFATRVISRLSDQPASATNMAWNLSAYNNVPDALKKPPEPKAPDIDVAAIMENNQRRMRLLDIDA